MYYIMIKLSNIKELKINPLLISLAVIFIMLIFLAFIDSLNIISMIGVFVFSGLFSSSLSTILFYISYREVGLAEKAINVFYSVVIALFTLNAIEFLLKSSIYNAHIVNNYLAYILLIFGSVYILSYFVTKYYSKWYRMSNLLIGITSIVLFLIGFTTSLIGYEILIVLLCAVMVLNRYHAELS